MTEAGWTSEKPDKEGWYWIRYGGETWMVFVYWEIDSWWVRRGVSRLTATVESFQGEWLGPITPNSYQQGRVAGLREAEKYALRCLKELQDKIRDLESGKCVLAGAQTKEGVEAWVHAKTLEASRIAKWITARIIEQQAQGGIDGA